MNCQHFLRSFTECAPRTLPLPSHFFFAALVSRANNHCAALFLASVDMTPTSSERLSVVPAQVTRFTEPTQGVMVTRRFSQVISGECLALRATFKPPPSPCSSRKEGGPTIWNFLEPQPADWRLCFSFRGHMALPYLVLANQARSSPELRFSPRGVRIVR